MPQGPLTPGSLQRCPGQTVPQVCTSLIKMPKYDKVRSARLPPLTVCSCPQGWSYEGRWMCNHTLGPTICCQAVLAQGLAHPGWSGGFLRARASPNGAERQSCDSTDTQQPVTTGPRPRALNGSWAAALVSSPETTSHPTAGVPAWPRPTSSASSTVTAQILPTVVFPWSDSPHRGQIHPICPGQRDPGLAPTAWGLLVLQRSPPGSFGCKHAAPRHGHRDTRASPHTGTRTSKEPLLLLPDLGRTGMAAVSGGQRSRTWQGSEPCSHSL